MLDGYCPYEVDVAGCGWIRANARWHRVFGTSTVLLVGPSVGPLLIQTLSWNGLRRIELAADPARVATELDVPAPQIITDATALRLRTASSQSEPVAAAWRRRALDFTASGYGAGAWRRVARWRQRPTSRQGRRYEPVPSREGYVRHRMHHDMRRVALHPPRVADADAAATNARTQQGNGFSQVGHEPRSDG
jgi:hypothetical protein